MGKRAITCNCHSSPRSQPAIFPLPPTESLALVYNFLKLSQSSSTVFHAACLCNRETKTKIFEYGKASQLLLSINRSKQPRRIISEPFMKYILLLKTILSNQGVSSVHHPDSGKTRALMTMTV